MKTLSCISAKSVRTTACGLLMLLCMLMQGVTLLPHHHHMGSEVPCFEVAHCYENTHNNQTQHHGDCCASDKDSCGDGDHNHADADDPCTAIRDVPGDLRINNLKDKLVPPEPSNPALPAFISLICECPDESTDAESGLEIKQSPLPVNIYIYTVTRSIPVRAPAVLS